VQPTDGRHLDFDMPSLDSTQTILAAAMRGAWQRQTLLTNNISNANTAGYKRQELNFQATLRSAISGERSLETVQFTPESQPQVVSPDGNGVSIDQESALLAENGLTYEALSQMLGAHNMTLLAAMGVH
jgi:flagellar basal-body rod protein FlgB